jgi:hypothetical protein
LGKFGVTAVFVDFTGNTDHNPVLSFADLEQSRDALLNQNPFIRLPLSREALGQVLASDTVVVLRTVSRV